MTWEGLTPPYRTIVADPPWIMPKGSGKRSACEKPWTIAPRPPPYSMMTNDEIAGLPVADLVGVDAHLYLWTTGFHLRNAYAIAEAWGFRFSQILTWCKPPRGIGPGWAFSNTNEFVLFCRRGSLPYHGRIDTTWWAWSRGLHSVKPSAFLDVVEHVSPGPYVELFARAPRLGWDSWGKGYEVAS